MHLNLGEYCSTCPGSLFLRAPRLSQLGETLFFTPQVTPKMPPAACDVYECHGRFLKKTALDGTSLQVDGLAGRVAVGPALRFADTPLPGVSRRPAPCSQWTSSGPELVGGRTGPATTGRGTRAGREALGPAGLSPPLPLAGSLLVDFAVTSDRPSRVGHNRTQWDSLVCREDEVD